MIQQAINQGIQLATALYTQTPQFQAKKSIPGLEKQWHGLEQEEEAYKKSRAKGRDEYFINELSPQMHRVGEQLSQARYIAGIKEEPMKGFQRGVEVQQMRERALDRMQQANEQAKNTIISKKAQKLGISVDMPTNFGRFDKLPKELQEAIIAGVEKDGEK